MKFDSDLSRKQNRGASVVNVPKKIKKDLILSDKYTYIRYEMGNMQILKYFENRAQELSKFK